MTIREYYIRERQRFLETCTRCGLCAEGCPILPHTDMEKLPPGDIQEAVFDCVAQGIPDRRAYTRAFACMECFRCTAGMCPRGLNPMLINEFIKGASIAQGRETRAYGDPRDADSVHRVLASVQTSGDEYRRITTLSDKGRVRYVFFPGCNVYFQPDMILSAMDIMDAVGDEYAFLPGLDYCCGDGTLFLGDIADGTARGEALVAAISRFSPEAVILWCPTCHCRFDATIKPAMDVPFEILSFPQYLATRMERLPLEEEAAGTVTLHEACKSAYRGIDLDGPRQVLRSLPGVTLREMEHHGRDTVCCGSGAGCWFPESGDHIREARLHEAARTGADRLVTVCHYCNQTFLSREDSYDFTVTNYISLVARAMGIERDEKFARYMRWGDVDRIIEDARDNIAASPFGRRRIVEVLQAVFHYENR